MAGISLEDAEAQLAAWLAADLAVSKGQSYSIAGRDGSARTLARADAAEITRKIQFWKSEISRIRSGGIRTRLAVLA